jgi:DNA-binding HxlR family transcriptional regulator
MEHKNDDYHVRAMVGIISSKWTLPVLYALKDGTKRYHEINKVLPDMTQKVLTDTLRRLERNGFIGREVYAAVPPKVEYALSDLGMSLLDVIVALLGWTEEHVQEVYIAQETYDLKGDVDELLPNC